jgi:hypothetical protein
MLDEKTDRHLVIALADQRKLSPKPKMQKVKVQPDLYAEQAAPGTSI